MTNPKGPPMTHPTQVLSDEQIEAIAQAVQPIAKTGHPSWEHAVARAIESATLDAVPVPQAMAIVTKALQEDAGYAWSWHCNVAMAAVDEGMEHYAANQAAARFMYSLANVDTTKHPGFPSPTQPPAQTERSPITEFQRGTLLIEYMGPDALAGRQMSLMDAFHLGIEAAERHHKIIGEEERAALKGQQ
jgi:hypothetical protein